MKTGKRLGVCVLLLLMISVPVFAGGGREQVREEAVFQPAPEGERVEITIWFGRDAFIPPDAFKSFMEKHPNIVVHVDVVPLEQIPAAFIRDFQAGVAPDIIQPDAGDAANLSTRGMLYDITPILEYWEENNPDLFNVMTPTAWEMASYQGVPHGLALHHGVYWNLYRKDVFEELGLDIPTTWEDVLDVGQIISEETDMYGFILNASRDQTPEWMKNHFAQMGGQWVDGVPQLDSEAGHYLLNWYQRAVKRGVIDPDTIAFSWPDMINFFAQGTGAMATISRNVFVNAIEPFIQYCDHWGLIVEPYVRPGGEADARWITNGWPYFVSSATRYPYEVGLVLQYLADDPQSLEVALDYQPASNSRVMSSDEYFAQIPWGEILVEPWGELEVRPYHINQAAMDSLLRDAQHEALRNPDADAREIARKYQARMDEAAAAVPGR